MNFTALSQYFLVFSIALFPHASSAAANAAPTIYETNFKFSKDDEYRTATITIKANGEESNAHIHISLLFNMPRYVIFLPTSFASSSNPQEALEKAKKQYPKWDHSVANIIETFFKEFSSPELIEKGLEWQRTTRLKELGKKAFQDFDDEIDDIIRYHHQFYRN